MRLSEGFHLLIESQYVINFDCAVGGLLTASNERNKIIIQRFNTQKKLSFKDNCGHLVNRL